METCAREVMSSPVTALPKGTTLGEAARILTEHGHGGAPVVDLRGEPVGMVTLFDIVVALAGLDSHPGRLGELFLASQRRWERGAEEDDREDDDDMALEVPVEDVMTPRAVLVAPGTPLTSVARTLAVEGIHRVLVRDPGGPLVGVITSLDVLRAQQGLPRPKRAAAH